MLLVFFKLPLALGPFVPPTFNIINTRAATAAAEITNEIEWISVYST